MAQKQAEIDKRVPFNLKSLARCHTELVIQTLSGIVRNSTSDSAKVAAATELLNRGWGRAPAEDRDGEGITIVIRRILEGPGIVEVIEPTTDDHTGRSANGRNADEC